MKKNAGIAFLLTAIASFSLSASADTDKKKTEQKNPYQDALDSPRPNDTLNKSLGSIGKRVVITISSGSTKKEFFAKIPDDRSSPPGEQTPLAIIEAGKLITAAVDKAKKSGETGSITISVETRVPKAK